MTTDKIDELIKDFQQALNRLEEALQRDPANDSLVVDGTIQRFEFTFELAWKLIKAVLKFQGIECSTPRAAIKEGFQKNIIEDGESWIDMLVDRNQTSHIYDEQSALKIYKKIKGLHLTLFQALNETIIKILKNES